MTFAVPAHLFAAQGDCGQPVSQGDLPTASDALLTLRAAVQIATCSLAICDADGNCSISSVDALRILKKAVGEDIELDCVCQTTSTSATSSSSMFGTTTSTTTSTSMPMLESTTTTTFPVTTTTTPGAGGVTASDADDRDPAGADERMASPSPDEARQTRQSISSDSSPLNPS